MTAPPEIDTVLLEQALPLVADGISKTQLRKELRCRYDTASDVWEAATAELEQVPSAVPALADAPAAQVVPPANPQQSRPPVMPPARRVPAWPILLLALPAFVAIWSGWVDLGRLTGFGVVHPFPGIPRLEDFRLNTAITLPIGLETYGGYALRVGMTSRLPETAQKFARHSAYGALALGIAGQGAYHLLIQFGVTAAPWWLTLAVSAVPVTVLALGWKLWHMVHDIEEE